jgi:hypothetical protein
LLSYTYLRVIILLMFVKLKKLLSFSAFETIILNSFLFFCIICLTLVSLNFSIFGYIFLFIKMKFFLKSSLGTIFPFLLFSLLLTGLKVFIIIKTFKNNIADFKLNTRNLLIIEQSSVFVFSIPILGFGLIMRGLVYIVQKKPFLRYSVIMTLVKKKANYIEEDLTQSIHINEYYHPVEQIRMGKFGSLLNSQDKLPKSFESVVYKKIALDKDKHNPVLRENVIDACHKLSNDRFDTASYLFRMFPDGFVNLNLLKGEGLPLFDPSKKMLIFNKSQKIMKVTDISEVFKPALHQMVKHAELPYIITYIALCDAQMQKHILKYSQECQIPKFLGILGDNLAEYQTLSTFKKQEGLETSILEFVKPEDRKIDLSHKSNLAEQYQMKFVTVGNTKAELKANFDDSNVVRHFCKNKVVAVRDKYLTDTNIDLKVILNLEAFTPEHSTKVITEIRTQFPELSSRILFVKPKFYPVCCPSEKALLTEKLFKYINGGIFY